MSLQIRLINDRWWAWLKNGDKKQNEIVKMINYQQNASLGQKKNM